MDQRDLQAQVVIVGLGPVGAVAANLAGAAGFEVLVVDRDLAPFAQPRAIVFDAEIMRVFASIGLAQSISAIVKPLGGSVYLGADRRPIRTFKSPGPAHAGAFAPSNLFYQPQLETVLRDGLGRFPNVRVLPGCEVSELEANGLRPRVVVRDAEGGEIRLDADFVLACDGASSTVRKRLEIGLDDIGFEERWLVVDAHMRGPMRWPNDVYEIPDEVRDGRYSLMICDPEGPATIIPGRGDHRRWEYMLRPDEADADAQDLGSLKARLSTWADPHDVEVVRSAVYRFRALIAHRWREGPVFLLGDAAHQTPPFFGQGMCHGIRDAAQLMWKLRLVADGHVSAELLDSYQVEREPHVRAIVAASVAAGAAVCITDPERALARDAEFRALEAARGGRAVAMTDVVPPIRGGVVDPQSGGRRLPEFALADATMPSLDARLAGRFTLLSPERAENARLDPALWRRWRAAGGQEITLSSSEDVEGRLAAWMSELATTAVIVRPDRYIYAVAADAADLPILVNRLLDQLGAPMVAANPATETNRP